MRYPVLVVAIGIVSGCSQLPTSPTAPGGTAMTEEATQARGGTDLPFRGSFEGTEVNQVVPPHLVVTGTAEGHATHLGRYTATFNVVVDLATSSSIGSIVLAAANGDELTGTFTGQGTTTAPNVAHIIENVTITGGTGRFAGATGTFTIDRTLDQLTGRSSGSLTDGSISLGS
jgi:hypothetical protein